MEEEDFAVPKVILTPKEILTRGLQLVHYSEGRVTRAKGSTNIQRFKDHYGCSPSICAQIFEDLQTSDYSPLDDNKISLRYLLISLNFLYDYRTEKKREPVFDLSPKVLREWVWYYVRKIQGLKQEKIVWPDSFGTDIFVLSVDCTDCPIEEPTHPEFTKHPDYYSFKENGAGLRYEFGIDLFRSALIWMNGPFLPGKFNDNAIFAQFGLKAKLAMVGKKALADKIYNGHPDECSTFNALDGKAVKEFKARVQMRHEQFNSLVKEFDCTSRPFRHKPDKIEKHCSCFEAVAVICQYKIEHEEPLFDVFAGL